MHEVELLLGARRRGLVPQFMKVGEVVVERSFLSFKRL